MLCHYLEFLIELNKDPLWEVLPKVRLILLGINEPLEIVRGFSNVEVWKELDALCEAIGSEMYNSQGPGTDGPSASGKRMT